MTTSYWRQQARPIIVKVIREVGTDDPKKLRKALREAYPFTERSMHPYKMWCKEVRWVRASSDRLQS